MGDQLKTRLYRLLVMPSLRVLWFFWQVLINVRLRLYQKNILPTYTAKAQVISVGNISLGGTGKTPLVAALLSYALSNNLRAAILTRGYKAKLPSRQTVILDRNFKGSWQEVGDEPHMLWQSIPGSTLYVGKKRVYSAILAQKRHDFLILDDGFQHLALTRNVDIVLLDVEKGIEALRPIPCGDLRESLRGLKRAQVIIYSKANMGDEQALRMFVKPYLAENVKEFSAILRQTGIVDQFGQEVDATALKKDPVVLISGIGNPDSFEKLVSDTGLNIERHFRFKDHHDYSRNELDTIIRSLKNRSWILTTEKDMIKFKFAGIDLTNVFSCRAEMKITAEFYDYVFGNAIAKT